MDRRGVVLEALSFAAYVVLFQAVFVDKDPPTPPSRIGWRESYQITMARVVATRLFATAGAGGVALTAWALGARACRRVWWPAAWWPWSCCCCDLRPLAGAGGGGLGTGLFPGAVVRDHDRAGDRRHAAAGGRGRGDAAAPGHRAQTGQRAEGWGAWRDGRRAWPPRRRWRPAACARRSHWRAHATRRLLGARRGGALKSACCGPAFTPSAGRRRSRSCGWPTSGHARQPAARAGGDRGRRGRHDGALVALVRTSTWRCSRYWPTEAYPSGCPRSRYRGVPAAAAHRCEVREESTKPSKSAILYKVKRGEAVGGT